MPRNRFASIVTLTAAIALTQLVGGAPVADAQTPVKLDSNFQGAVGLGLVGAELGLVLPAVIGMDGVWPYILFPVALGGGGAAAGYFAIDKGDHVDAGIVTLGIGVALVIPAVIATVALTAYEPSDSIPTSEKKAAISSKKDFGDDGADAVSDAPAAAPTNGAPVAEPPAATQPPAETPTPAPAPTPAPQASFGLIRYQPNGAVILGIPAISVASSYTAVEASRYGVAQQAELQVPVLSGSF